MKKFMRTRLLLVLTSILILGCACGSKITVGPKDADYSQIQEAIDNSSKGDTIEVQSGVYQENVRIMKPITLQGIDSGNGQPVVDAGGSGSVIIIMANDTTVKGFNVTGSGGCGCGNAGIKVDSSNNIIQNNVIYENKYGIYVESTSVNNTFYSNDMINNSITTSDNGKDNQWNVSLKAGGLQGLLEMISGPEIKGNHYSDYDEDSEGCVDANNDRICDRPKVTGTGAERDYYPSISKMN